MTCDARCNAFLNFNVSKSTIYIVLILNIVTIGLHIHFYIIPGATMLFKNGQVERMVIENAAIESNKSTTTVLATPTTVLSTLVTTTPPLPKTNYNGVSKVTFVEDFVVLLDHSLSNSCCIVP